MAKSYSSIGKINTITDESWKNKTVATDVGAVSNSLWKSSITSPTLKSWSTSNQALWDYLWLNKPKANTLGSQNVNKGSIGSQAEQTTTQAQQNALWQTTQQQTTQLWQQNVPPQYTPIQDKDYILDVNELSPEMRTVYDQMTKQEQAQFKAIGEEARKTGQDTAKMYADYIKQYQQNKTFAEWQQARKEELYNMETPVLEAESWVRTAQARTQLSNLKQSLNFLWTRGQPWVSSGYLEEIDKQISQAENVFKSIKMREQYATEAREKWWEFDTASYEKEMQDMMNDLDRKVDWAIQDAIMSFNKSVEDIETEEDYEKLRISILDQIDEKVAEYGAGTVAQMNYLVQASERIASDIKDRQEIAREYEKNNNIVNKEMSIALWYYVNGNGDPIISASTGARIDIPEEAPIEPIWDKESGQLITFTTDETWNIVAKVDQVIDQPTFQEWTIQNLVNSVSNWHMTIAQALQILPKSAQSWFINALWNLPSKKETEDKSTEWKKWDDWRFYRTNESWGLEVSDWLDIEKEVFNWAEASNYILSWNINLITDQMEYGRWYDCWEQQCWYWYNRTVGKKNGTWVWDTYASKQKFIDPSVTQWQIGDWVVFNPWQPWDNYYENWHIWVIASGIYINEEWVAWYDVLSANMYGDETLSKDFIPESLIANTWWWFIPTTASEEFKWEQEVGANQQEKEAILSAIRTGNLTNTQKDDYRQKALQEGWIDEYMQSEGKAYDVEKILRLKWDITGEQAYKDVLDVKRWYDNINSIYKEGYDASWLDDISAINSLQRMIDPWATVREGDVVLIESAIPYFKKIDPRFKWERLKEWDKLPASLRKKLKDTAMSVYNWQVESYNNSITNLYKKNMDMLWTTLWDEWLLFDVAETDNRTIARTGTTEDGREVVQYSDWTIEYR